MAGSENNKKIAGGVEYHVADQSYFEKRQLKRYAGAWSLWALGVGAVISGDFSGWNLGVGQAGFGGFLIALSHFSWDALWNIQPESGHSRWLPRGWGGVGAALPFAIWLYLAIEQLPLAAEESTDISRDMPRGLIWGLATLVVTGLLVTFLNMGIGQGAAYFGSQTEEPLLDGFKLTVGVSNAKLLGFIAVAGLIASFHAIIYAFGRNIYSLSRAGYFPHWLSITHQQRRTPYVALIAGSVVGYLILLALYFIDPMGSGAFGGVILNMAVFGAVIAYVMQMASFIVLRKRYPTIERPYMSPFGNMGAAISLVIAAVTLVWLFQNPDFRPGVIGVAIWFLCGLLYFGLYGRRTLVYSPEEEFAIRQSEPTRT